MVKRQRAGMGLMYPLVNLPEVTNPNAIGDDKGVCDTGEGGLAFFFVILPHPRRDNQRLQCIVQGGSWGQQDVVLAPKLMQRLNDELHQNADDLKEELGSYVSTSASVDLCMLIGSTPRSIWIGEDGHYFKPTYKDLTDKGKELFNLIGDIYFEDPLIVTLLDT